MALTLSHPIQVFSGLQIKFNCRVCTAKQQHISKVFLDCRLELTLSCQIEEKGKFLLKGRHKKSVFLLDIVQKGGGSTGIQKF